MERLAACIASGDWLAARSVADDLHRLCWHRHVANNPPTRLRIPSLRLRLTHPERIALLLERLSRNRVIEREEAYEIAWRRAKRISGNPHLTMKPFAWLEYPAFYDDGRISDWASPGRYWRGEYRTDKLTPYPELKAEAKRDHCQFCDIAAYRRAELRKLDRREQDVLEVQSLINKLTRTIRDERKNRDHRPA